MSIAATPADGDEPLALVGTILGGPRAEGAAGAVIVRAGQIVSVHSDGEPAALPARLLRAAYVAPGFVDLQVNGGFGHEVDDDPAALAALAQRVAATGVTAFLPTLVSRAMDRYGRCFAALDAARATASSAAPVGARLLGLHLEGPFLSVARAGAHAVSAIEAATADGLDQLADPARVRLVTLAPERAGALPLVARLRARGIVVSLGHTDATFEAFTAGVDAGATLATHVWNAMSPFHHRAPGAAGAALADERITALAIADGVHIHPAAFAVAVRAKGLDRLGLVTDAVAGAGLPGGGPTMLAGLAITVDDTSARLADGTLAGSTLTMDRAVRNARSIVGLSAADAVHLATTVPARALGLLARGPLLRPGAPADLVLLDDDLHVQATLVGGRVVFRRDRR